MATVIDFNPNRVFNANGSVSAGATVRFYRSGTTTLKTVYADEELTVPHPSPLVANSAGIFPEVYTDGSPIKAVVRTAAGATLYTIDPVLGAGGQSDAALTYGSRSDMLSASIGYTSPASIIVKAGDVLTADGASYTVAASGASDHDFTTAGGAKLYAHEFERVILMIGQSQVVGSTNSTGGDQQVLQGISFWNNNLANASSVTQLASDIVPGTQWVQAKFGTAPLNIGPAGNRANNIGLQMAKALKNWHGVKRVYLYTLGIGSTAIENLIKEATLTANGWTYNPTKNLTGIMYGANGIRAAINAIPGRTGALLDAVALIHGGANADEAPTNQALKMKAVFDDLVAEGLADADRTPFLTSMIMTYGERAIDVRRHLYALRTLQYHQATTRIVETVGLETADGLHLTGSAMTEWGNRAAAALTAPPVLHDISADLPMGQDVATALFSFCDASIATNPETAPWPPLISMGSGFDAVDGPSSGWQLRKAATTFYAIARRRVWRVPQRQKLAIEVQASSSSSFAMAYRIYQWDKDRVALPTIDAWFNDTALIVGTGEAKVYRAEIYPAALASVLASGPNVRTFHADARYFTWGLRPGSPTSDDTRFLPRSEAFVPLTDDEIAGWNLPPNRGKTLTIASDTVTPTAEWHLVDTQGAAATDDLATINLTNVPEGAVFRLSSVASARVVTVKHGTGNIQCGADRVLSNTGDTITFVKRTIGSTATALMVGFADNN